VKNPAALLSLVFLACTTPAPAARDAGPAQARDAGPTGQEDAGPPTLQLRVGTLNTRRFFDPTCDTGQCGPGAYEEQPSQAAFESKADTLANGIRQMGVDIILLQEVETQASLDALQARLGDLYSVFVLGEIGTAASVDVAVMARGNLVQVERHRDIPLTRPDGTATTFSREFLEVQLNVDGRLVVAFCAHFRSKFNDDPGRRVAEARTAHAIVTSRTTGFPGALIVMGGDLNDTPDSEPLQALTSDGKLLRVAEELVPDDATYSYAGDLQAIDHLLLASPSAATFVPGTAQVFGPVASGYAGSDHAALKAVFRLP
jgi:predicted extracellular nuclease